MAAVDERTVMFECVTGSHLYGTSLPTSDRDYAGVFAPSLVDHLGLQNCPSEWTLNEKASAGLRNEAGDVDRKFFSVRRFCQLAGEGQPGQLEMLFAPPTMVLRQGPLWCGIAAVRDAFLSRRGVAPFVGFAKAQAYKATVKGENLRKVRALVEKCRGLAGRVSDHIEVEVEPSTEAPGRARLVNEEISLVLNGAAAQVEIAGRKWDVGVQMKLLAEGLQKLLSTYGARSEAAAAATYDFKSILHAVRLLGEAEEFLRDGRITLPRPPSEVEGLMLIRRQVWPGPNDDVFAYIESRIRYLREEVEPKSPLPREPDWKRIQQACIDVHAESLGLGG